MTAAKMPISTYPKNPPGRTKDAQGMSSNACRTSSKETTAQGVERVRPDSRERRA